MTKLKNSNCYTAKIVKQKTQIVKNSNCDKTQSPKCDNSNCDKTQNSNSDHSKTQIVTKLKNLTCDKTLIMKNLNLWYFLKGGQ